MPAYRSSELAPYPVPSDLFHGRDVKPLFRLHRWLDVLPASTPLRRVLKRRYDREFAANRKSNLFRGIFDSFAAAEASAPANRVTGYDHADAASLYLNRTRRVFPADYPVMFWLTQLIEQGQRRILDLGGHIGVSYYAYRHYIPYPKELRWTVHDVPAVIARGREIAKENDNSGQLDFCDRFEECAAPDIVLAIGSLQYLPDTLPQRLTTLGTLPRHLVLNLVPIHMERTYYTLQSIGTAFCPYRIFAMDEFIKGFEALGYQLTDWWENPEKNCIIPFYPAHSLDRYYGFLLSQPASS